MRPRSIKKCIFNPGKLKDTQTSTYITLADVKQLVLANEAFQVVDAKSGDDLTRSILLQIILEEEGGGVPMFSSNMLAQIIRFYGHAHAGHHGFLSGEEHPGFHGNPGTHGRASPRAVRQPVRP